MFPMVKFVIHWFHILFRLARANKVDLIPYGNGLIPYGNEIDPSGSQMRINPSGSDSNVDSRKCQV